MFPCPYCGYRFETAAARDDHVGYIIGTDLIESDKADA